MIAARAHFARAKTLFDTQFIPRTAPAAFQLAQHATRQQVIDIAQCGVRRALAQRRPLGVGKLAFKAVQHAVEHLGLPRVYGRAGPALPELGFVQHAGQDGVRALHGAQQAAQKPAEPWCYVQRAFLRGLELVVVVFTLALYLGAEAVVALAKILPHTLPLRGSLPLRRALALWSGPAELNP